MSNEYRGAEWKVGLFIAIGIAVITFMSVKFGKLGTGLQSFYDVKVEFPDASGLLKGGEVRMAGARIGFAAEAPTLVDGKYAVMVDLKIRDGVNIPKNSRFTIDTSGLMGDAYVDIALPEKPDRELLSSGSMVFGTRKPGIADLTEKASQVLVELKKRLEDLEAPIKDVRDRLLSDTNMMNLEKAIGNVSEFSVSLKATGKELNAIITEAKGAGSDLTQAMSTAKSAMAKVDGVVAKVDEASNAIRPALDSLKKTSDGAEKAVTSMRALLTKANQGQGALGMLLGDRETAENLKSFIRNLKSRGILWYKDKPEEQPKPRR